MNKGQFLISLAYHANFTMNWKEINANEIFKEPVFLKTHQIRPLPMKLKHYLLTNGNIKITQLCDKI
jgi:hypothetical protein